MFKKILLFFFFLYAQSSSVIDIVFTVKHLSTNDRLKLNFFTMIASLCQHTSIENLHLHVIGDLDSQHFVDQTLQTLNFNPQVINFLMNKTIVRLFNFLRLINLISMT
jgi:hypothetical protein